MQTSFSWQEFLTQQPDFERNVGLLIVGAAPDVVLPSLSEGSHALDAMLVIALNSAMERASALRDMAGLKTTVVGLSMDWRFDFKNSYDVDFRICSEYGSRLSGQRHVRLAHLGYNGFSRNPQIGVFSGYTVAYVALQLALSLASTKVWIAGVPLSYSVLSTAVRLDGTSDMDLHVLGKQRYWMRFGVDRLQAAGIPVEVLGGASW